eukprot:TRINITY_DN1196_c2_g2_i1.p1 TRINITY_DN1196_c2_g2~~TRINITY_DN1196_c2_g2_i1.p1  ORF type:complete len:597 (-),score=135.97 TRINITY_DN1196_c2_g2_i1:34-1824(-)
MTSTQSSELIYHLPQLHPLPSLRQPVPLTLTIGSPFDTRHSHCDSIIYLTNKPLSQTILTTSSLYPTLNDYHTNDRSFANKVSLVISSHSLGNRFIHAPVSRSYRDYDDVRSVLKRAREALKTAITSGSKCPLICVDLSDHESVTYVGYTTDHTTPSHPSFLSTLKAIIHSLYQELYLPLEAKNTVFSCSQLTVTVQLDNNTEDKHTIVTALSDTHFIRTLVAVEQGRILCRDIGGNDPEHMSPPQCAAYIKKACESRPNLHVEVIDDYNTLLKEYPLLAAVGRCSMATPRHRPCVVKMRYSGSGVCSNHVYLVGKGITYDTGGADVKVGGAMTGMSRDKCGAAALVGFMLSVNDMNVQGTDYTAYLAFVRNSIGSDSYVTDEVITARSGVTVRVGNTDAEGRMVMADLIHEAQMRIHTLPPTHHGLIITCATLTGHVVRAYGMSAAIVPNSVALSKGIAHRLLELGESVGEPFEVSRLRKEDFEFIDSSSTFADLSSCNSQPSTMTNRGHQFPGAFLIRVSGLWDGERGERKEGGGGGGGLVREGRDIPFLHLDIAAVSGEGYFGRATAFPMLTLVEALGSEGRVSALLKGKSKL